MPLLLSRMNDRRVLQNVRAVTVTSDTLELRGQTVLARSPGLTIADLLAARDQLAALANNPDEPVVPLVMTAPDDVSLTGMVKPRSSSVTMDAGALESGIFPWELTVDRITAGNLPRIEKQLTGGVRTNNLTVVLADVLPWDTYPTSADAYSFDTRIDVATDRVGPGAAMKHLYGPGGSTSAYMPGTPVFAQMTLPPANYYDGAAYIKANGRPVIGRLYPSNAANNAAWEFGNGLVKLEPGTGTALLKITLPVFATPTVWGTPILIDVGRYFTAGAVWVPSATTDVTNVSIIRNSPEICVIRLTVESRPTTGEVTYFTLDITSRRGDRGFQMTLKSPWAGQWGTGYNSATATTTVTIHGNNAGINRAAADGDGNKVMLLASSIPGTIDNVAGRFYMGSFEVRSFGLYGVIGGAGAATQDTGLTLLSQYFAAQGEVQQVTVT